MLVEFHVFEKKNASAKIPLHSQTEFFEIAGRRGSNEVADQIPVFDGSFDKHRREAVGGGIVTEIRRIFSGWSVRIPAILGFLTMLFALFEFLRPRVGAVSALTAICLPLTTKAYEYAFEARTYGTLLGIAAFTLYAWGRMNDAHSRRVVWRAATAVGLSLALLTHTFGVFVFPPILAGQAAWCVTHRRLAARG